MTQNYEHYLDFLMRLRLHLAFLLIGKSRSIYPARHYLPLRVMLILHAIGVSVKYYAQNIMIAQSWF